MKRAYESARGPGRRRRVTAHLGHRVAAHPENPRASRLTLPPALDRAGREIRLLDVIAPTKEQATAVVKNFGQVVKEGKLFVHPIIRSNF